MVQDSLFKSAFTHSSIGMALVAPDGKWLDVNASLSEILGYSKEELLECDFQNLTQPDDLYADLKLLSECLSNKRDSYKIEKRYFHKDGSIIWALLTVSLIRENGEPSFFISQIQDVTESKNSQQALVQAAKLATLGEVAGTIAHEVNNPLTIIEGQTSLLKRSLLKNGFHEPKAFDQLSKINKTIGRISSIIQSMKNLSRDGSNEKVHTCKLHELIQDNLALCRYQLRKDKIDITIDVDESIFINVRPIDFGQSFLNLISNSRHALQESSIKTITVTAKEHQGVVKIYVEDTGHGIDNNIASKVMSPFFTTKSRSEGTGIGLSITKKLLNRMDGDIKLIRPNNNTTFCIEIPSAQQKAQNIA